MQIPTYLFFFFYNCNNSKFSIFSEKLLLRSSPTIFIILEYSMWRMQKKLYYLGDTHFPVNGGGTSNVVFMLTLLSRLVRFEHSFDSLQPCSDSSINPAIEKKINFKGYLSLKLWILSLKCSYKFYHFK